MRLRFLKMPKKGEGKSHFCKGSVLTVSVVATAMLSLLAAGLVQMSLREAGAVYREEKGIKAFYLAEAGFSEAYALLKENFDNKDQANLFPLTQLGGGSYDVEILQPNGRVVIQSVGTVKNVQKTIRVEVFFDDGLQAFKYGLFSNKKGDLRGNPTIHTDIHSNEVWNIQGNATVLGGASAVGEVEISGNASVYSVRENVPAISFPLFDFNYYYNLSDPADRYMTDQDWNNINLQPANGVVYVDGDVRVRGNSRLTGALVATGNVTIEGNFTQIGVDGLPAIMSRGGNIILRGNVTVQEGLIYANTGDIEIRGNLDIKGNVISFSEIVATGNVNLTAIGLIPSGVQQIGEGFRKLTYHE